LNSNLNSAGAFAVLDGVAKSGMAPSNEFLKFIDEAFGLEIGKTTPDISDDIKAKIVERTAAKESKEYATADKLRDEISAQGVELLDSADGVKWAYAN
jgi:cysteinyl-tRNA synthetase